MQRHQNFQLRPEQQSAIDQTFTFWQQSQGERNRKFLWNAKPRFGKTITAYSFAEKIQAKRILIITNRPAISDSWISDFSQYFSDTSDYIFATPKGDKALSENFKEEKQIYSRDELLKDFDLLKQPLIFFISLPDLKGRDIASQDFKQKNQWIFNKQFQWDLLIIDEGHDGVKTTKTKRLLSELCADFVLYLSGTPFRAIADKDFKDNQIYNWSYIDEQRAHSDMPKMNFLTIPLTAFLDQSNSDLAELFRVQNGYFAHQELIAKWLDALVAVFHKISDSDNWLARHSLWLLSGVAECAAMQKALNAHPFFSNYNVILATGRDTYNQKNLKSVRAAIGDNSLLTKTITLSCGQLTTGITIPDWSTVLMLYSSVDLERVSATQYLQAAFRAQNPCIMNGFTKTKCLVIDFFPNRALTILQEYATSLCVQDQKQPSNALSELLRFLNVQLLERSLDFRDLFATDILELPRQMVAKEIVDAKFTNSSKLFNAQSIFHMSEHAHQIICKLNAMHKGRIEKSPRMLARSIVNVDENGDAILTAELIQQTFQELIDNPKYATLARIGKQKINNLAILQATKSQQNDLNSELKNYPKKNQDEIRAFLVEVENEAIKKLHKHRKREEESYRDKLCGFTRTIPALLHVYGKSNMSFADLTQITPDSDFENVTGITKKEFQILLDEAYFNQTNCTLAVREFMQREDEFSDYFSSKTRQSIFDFIPSMQNYHVFTPQKIVKLIVDYIEQQKPELLHSRNTKIFDPSAKSGLFLAEISKRLFQNLRQDFKSDHDCLLHILTQQIYAWSPNHFLQQSTRKTLLRFLENHPNEFSKLEIEQCENHLIEFNPIKAKGGFSRHEVRQYIQLQWENDMKFDIILGNPPYQYGRRQIYADFYRLAVDLDPEIICMIFPTGWQKTNNHNGLGLLNKSKYKRDPHIVQIDNYKESSNKLFSELGTGGVNIILRDKNHDNHGQIRKLEEGKHVGTMILPIDDSEIAKPAELTCLIKPMKLFPKMESLGSSRKPYGFYADPLRHPEKYDLQLFLQPQKPDDVRLFGLLSDTTRGYRFISRAKLPKVSLNIDSHKIFVPKAWGNMSERIGLGGSYANICVANPGDVCSETFIEFGPFKNQDEAIKMAKYFMTKFFRALLFLAKDSQNTAKDKYKYIPLPDLQEDVWQKQISELDDYLFDKYNVPTASREFIRKNIQPRSEKNIEIL